MDTSRVPIRNPHGFLPGQSPSKHHQTPSFFSCAGPSNFPRFQTEALGSGLESRNRLFIVGMGLVGRFFAQHLKHRGWVVSGTCTSEKKKKELEQIGFDAMLFDAIEPDFSILEMIKTFSHLLVSIPPIIDVGDPLLQHDILLRSALSGGNLQWLCYLSSTSVYGDCGGAWVNEDYPANPTSEAAKLRVVAEEGWLHLGHHLGLSSQVFRLGGIYGPGRSAVDTLIKQGPMSEGQKMRASRRFTSRVHVHDICQALEASIYKPSFRRIFNIVDDDPAPREEVFAYAENLIEMKWPGQLKCARISNGIVKHSENGSSRGKKRVSNTKMKRELGVRLLHPSYKSGLQSIIDQMGSISQVGS